MMQSILEPACYFDEYITNATQYENDQQYDQAILWYKKALAIKASAEVEKKIAKCEQQITAGHNLSEKQIDLEFKQHEVIKTVLFKKPLYQPKNTPKYVPPATIRLPYSPKPSRDNTEDARNKAIKAWTDLVLSLLKTTNLKTADRIYLTHSIRTMLLSKWQILGDKDISRLCKDFSKTVDNYVTGDLFGILILSGHYSLRDHIDLLDELKAKLINYLPPAASKSLCIS